MPALKTNWRAGERNIFIRKIVGFPANNVGQLGTEISTNRHSMTRITHRVIHAIEAAGMRHDVESEVERASPNKFHFGIAQLGIHADHALTQDLRTLTHRIFGLRKESRAAAE